jgi:glycosyltransferase involved in cell wall biosynthesis
LKILVLTGWLNGGGAERVVVNLLKGPDLVGGRVELGLLRRQGSYIDDVDPGLIHTRSWGERLFPSDGSNSSFYLPHRIAMSALTGPLVFRRIVKATRPDLVLSVGRGPNLLTFGALAGMGAERPAWIVRDGNNLGRMTGHEALGGVRRSLGLELTRKAYRAADCVLVNSAALARDMADFLDSGESAVRVIRNPLDIESISRGANEGVKAIEGPFIFSAGRLVHQKGYDVLVRAFAASGFRNSHKLVIAGEGPELNVLQALASELGVAGQVVFPGFQKNPWAWMRHCDLYTLSSRWEGCPSALAEALVCGAPAVATDCRFGPSELITHERDGWLVPAEDPSLLAQGIDTLLSDAALRARLGITAAQRMEEFDLKRILPQYGELFAEVVRKRRRVPVHEDYGFDQPIAVGAAD